MKIASFNINDINRRLTNLLDWLGEAEPDIVCLQELKSADAEFPAGAIQQARYHAVWRGERRWNGVAILARWPPVLTRQELPGDPDDRQSRYLEAAVNGVLVASIYAPNGNPQPGPKFDYKLAWLTSLASRRYGSLNSVLDAGLFQTQAKMLRLFRLIATMDAAAPLPSLADQAPTWDLASKLARSWGLNQLADRLDEMARPSD